MPDRPALPTIVLVLWMALASLPSIGAPPSFQISEIYSNLDGSLQFIRLTETQGLDGQHHFAGLTLTSTHNGVTKQITFPNDLWTDQTAHRSVVIASNPRGDLVPEPGDLNVFPISEGNDQHYGAIRRPDFAIPQRFLAIDGGSINFADVDELRYEALPTDGENGLDRDLIVGRAVVWPDDCIPIPQENHFYCGPVGLLSPPVSVVEYYSASLDHYFYSASAPDIDALDSGRISGWERTGQRFMVAAANGQPVCRYYIPPALGDSHFYSASVEECAEVHARFPAMVLEAEAAFYVSLPSATGECGSPWDYDWMTPVYRLWNGRADSNHRYTTDKGVRDAMVAQGYVAEGYGPDGVAFCAE